MGFTLKFGHCVKRFNSTLQPDTSDWFETEAVWKNAKDIDTPNWHIYAPGVSALLDWNYAYMPERNAYYWITDIISLGNNRWEIHATLDMLATCKSAITGTSCFVSYGNNAVSQVLDDTRIPSVTTPTVKDTTAQIFNRKYSVNGSYIVSVIGTDGSTVMYLLTKAQLSNLMDTIPRTVEQSIEASQELGQTIEEFNTTYSLSFVSGAECVRECTWIPISVGDVPAGAESYIYLGAWSTGIKAKQVSMDTVFKVTDTVAIPWQAQGWKRNREQIQLYVPFIGSISIPVDKCYNEANVLIDWAVSCVSGDTAVRVYTPSGYTLYNGTVTLGWNYPIGAFTRSIPNVVGGSIAQTSAELAHKRGMVEAIAGVFGMGLNPVAGAVGAGYGVTEMQLATQQRSQAIIQQNTVTYTGTGNYTATSIIGQTRLYHAVSIYYPPIDDVNYQAMYGHPVMQMTKPVAGYCQTNNFSLAGAQRATTKGAIATMLNTGVFIE